MRVLTIAVTIALLHQAAQPSVWAHAGGSQGDRWAQEFCKASFCGIMSPSKWELCCEGYGECCAYLQLEAGGGGGSPERVSSSSEYNSGSSHAHGLQPPPAGPHHLPKPQRLSTHPQPPSIRPLSQPKPPSIRPHPPSIRPNPPSIRPNPPSSRAHPPSSQPHPPYSQPHPPSSQPHPLSRPEPPPGRLPSRPHFQRLETGRKGLKKANQKPRKVAAQDATSLLVAPEQSSDNEVYSPPAPKSKDRWGEEFCKVSYCGIMPSVKWQHCCDNFGQCCVYLLLAKPKDLKSPFAFQEIATVTQPKRKFEYGFSHRPQHTPGSSRAQDNRLKTFLYSPQEIPVQTAPSTPKAAIKHVTTSSGPVWSSSRSDPRDRLRITTRSMRRRETSGAANTAGPPIALSCLPPSGPTAATTTGSAVLTSTTRRTRT
ncbi:pollen-specific leucine-rich repeat extensin-like protein 2 [Penaeus chinensis]|uniref:pollen-specific leucine-rich repeat extensin-like protein 2 n=1 Tax=Penaeus chinensis TaxID=139456 RepID=UPI001FB62CFB|nr:pollen-specific leucine-rich repeat extensin-like protein 2 [Penaeus chinensis]